MSKEITKTNFVAPDKSILIAPHTAVTIGVQLGNTGVATENGVKFIPAGTPIGGTTSALTKRDTVLQVTNKANDGANAQGILLNGVDVTNGNANATMVIVGTVDTSKCPTIDDTVKTALTKISFVNGGKN